MLQRCQNPKNKDFHRYGGRGIKVCDRWKEFANFLDDMGRRPDGAYTIEREDNDGNYEPGNCRWATRTEQGRNREDNRLLTSNGISHPVSEWAEVLGVNVSTLFDRIARGWSDEEIVMTPIGSVDAEYIRFRGKLKTRDEWARELKISKGTLKARLARGWSVEKSLTTPLSKVKSEAAKGSTWSEERRAKVAATWERKRDVEEAGR